VKYRRQKRNWNVIRILLVVLLVIVVAGALPVFPYSAAWGLYPSSGLGLILLIAIILLLLR
jgi:low affinity Fe/Cu permease